jgi:aminopeptidase-like protein
VPGTIGSLTWLSRNPAAVPRIRHGLTLACLGDEGQLNYKRSRQGDAVIDRAAALALMRPGPAVVTDFSPFGYDERQYCSPGFDLPVGSLTRSSHGSFPEYHTDADNLDFVKPERLEESLRACLKILAVLEENRTLVNQKPFGEPQLGRYGLYDSVGGVTSSPDRKMALLWVLNLCDGGRSLLDVAERSNLDFSDILAASQTLEEAGLLRPA